MAVTSMIVVATFVMVIVVMTASPCVHMRQRVEEYIPKQPSNSKRYGILSHLLLSLLTFHHTSIQPINHKNWHNRYKQS